MSYWLKSGVEEGRVVFGKMTDQGQQRYEAVAFTDTAHNPPSSTGKPSREMNDGTILHLQAEEGAEAHESPLECLYINQVLRLFLAKSSVSFPHERHLWCCGKI